MKIDMDRKIYGGTRIARLPAPLQKPALVARWLSRDVADRALGRRDALTPPPWMQNVGEGNFRAVGEEFLHYMQALGGLQPTDRVLDMGCGIGRTAHVLARVLEPPGSYDGFDIVPEAIDWCARHYRKTPAPFRFAHADIHNTLYNQGGRIEAKDFRFPYADDSFDMGLAVSLFTHLVPESADHYLAEASRVLAPGGRLLLTWFVLTDEVPTPRPYFDFKPTDGPAQVLHHDNPEAAIAYPEDWLKARLAAHGLKLRQPILWGSWRGITSVSFQDIAVIDHA
jgi:SAM-dependent methyltransferase